MAEVKSTEEKIDLPFPGIYDPLSQDSTKTSNRCPKWNGLTFVKYMAHLVCFSLFAYEITFVMIKAIKRESFQAEQESKAQLLKPPIITLCPGDGWKSTGPFKNDDQFENSFFKAEEIFHPKTLEYLNNDQIIKFQEQYSSYYGVCFVIEKLTLEKISDYGFQIVLNNTMDYNYMMHDMFENEWLLMNVYPYEVVINRLNAENNDDIGGSSIQNSKEIIQKIVGNDGCDDRTLKELIDICWKDELARSLEKASIKCKVPALRFTRFDTSHLDDCSTREEALEVEGMIYVVAQDNLDKDVCGKICQEIKYHHNLAIYSKKVLSKEIKEYGEGYFILWSYYTNLNVKEKVETYLFDFDAVVVAMGGNLGLFLGFSLKSIIVSIAEFINAIWSKYKSRKSQQHSSALIRRVKVKTVPE